MSGTQLNTIDGKYLMKFLTTECKFQIFALDIIPRSQSWFFWTAGQLYPSASL
jgi:hypothetical protein